MKLSHLFSLSQVEPQHKFEGGYRVRATKTNFPALKGMSFYKLILYPLGAREPHWHANADELGYCLKGQVLITIFASGNKREVFLVNAGETFFIPSGSLHGIENVGEGNAELILEFSHEEPEDFGLSSAFGMFSDAVLGNTWNVQATTFKALKRSTKEILISKEKNSPSIPTDARYVSAFRFNLAAASPLVESNGGLARVARQNVWSVLKRQAVYSLELNGKGMREPHWHPETAELGYVAKGRARMSIQSPDSSVDTYELNEGDIYFIPKAYPHHIENLTEGPLHFLIFFDQAMPTDIGFTASVKSFSKEALSASLGTPLDFFEKLPTYFADLFIVEKTNPLD